MREDPKPTSPNPRTIRPPVVVVLGHVDHGKTTLLDAIRKTDVSGKEHGGITQSISTYLTKITRPSSLTKSITFIDTPGHEAFSAMRSRGAKVADIAILVVAANDSVMPQTVEAIKAIKMADIPYIVAINKIDLPEANVDKTVKDLSRHQVRLENYGGQVPFVKISAKKGDGVRELLDLTLLVADLAELTTDRQAPLEATVIESKLDKNRGPVATIVVKNGTLTVGQEIFIEGVKSKLRAIFDPEGTPIPQVLPGASAEILGLSPPPPVGAQIQTSPPDKSLPTESLRKATRQSKQGVILNLILRTDTLGSLEAITAKIPDNLTVLSSGTGEITEADILLAKSTKAIVIGFNVKVGTSTLKLAAAEKVLVRTYKIIYELLEELADAATAILEPKEKEEILGQGQIIAEFPYEKMRVCGTKVLEGRLARADLVRVSRAGEMIGQSTIKSLRIGKQELTKVETPKECGVLLHPQLDFCLGDDIISYRLK